MKAEAYGPAAPSKIDRNKLTGEWKVADVYATATGIKVFFTNRAGKEQALTLVLKPDARVELAASLIGSLSSNDMKKSQAQAAWDRLVEYQRMLQAAQEESK